MKKSLVLSLTIPIAAVSLFASLVAMPAGAQQQIKDSCTLSRDIKIADKVIAKDRVVKDGTASIKDVGQPPLTGDVLVKEWGTICLINTVNTVTDWLFFILLTIAFVFIAFAGFKWMTSKDNATAQKEAGQMIFVALVGIVIAALARILPAVLIGILL
ncbi:MAG: hypothetical protein HYS15_02405 [Candidatus Spechtbacteria bacterium]|nr:hypothetical protein [Candidatus Spechtbacteria bacterium]